MPFVLIIHFIFQVMDNPILSIVVPCFNEADNLPELLSQYDSAILNNEIEVILVNTISHDNSIEVLKYLLPKYKRFLKVIHVKERGYGFGILSGLQQAKGEFIGWTHGDLQAPADDVVKALTVIKEQDYNNRLFVKGSRVGRPLFDSFFTWGMSVFETVYFGTQLNDIFAQPNIFHRSFFASWKNPPRDFALDLYALYAAKQASLTMYRFPVRFLPRKYGKSSWNTELWSKWKFIKRTIVFSIELKRNQNEKT